MKTKKSLSLLLVMMMLISLLPVLPVTATTELTLIGDTGVELYDTAVPDPGDTGTETTPVPSEEGSLAPSEAPSEEASETPTDSTDAPAVDHSAGHPVCGATCDDDANHENIVWTAVDSTYINNLLNGNTQVEVSGDHNWYLTEYIEMSGSLHLTGNLNLCLNGYSINGNGNEAPIYMKTSGTALNICDCDGYAVIQNTGSGSAVSTDSGVTTKLYGVRLTASSAAALKTRGDLYMYDTVVYASKTWGRTVDVVAGNFYMYGGSISNTGTEADALMLNYTKNNAGTAYIYGGSIEGTQYGICNSYGKIVLSGAPAISGTKAGIYLKSDWENLVEIGGELTNEEPYTVEYAAGLDFATGWNTYMNGQDPSDYFVNTDSTYKAKLNADGVVYFNYPYEVFLPTIDNVTVTASPAGGQEGDKITLTVTADRSSVAIKSVTAVQENGTEVTLEETATTDTGSTYEFELPASDVTVSVEVRHFHPVCGETCDGDCGVAEGGHEAVEWKPLTNDIVNADDFAFTAGYYYLAEDVITSANLDTSAKRLSAGDFHLCLNGYTWNHTNSSYIFFHTQDSNEKSFRLCDCGTAGKLTTVGKSIETSDSYTSVYLYGGNITTGAKMAVKISSSEVGGLHIKGAPVISGSIRLSSSVWDEENSTYVDMANPIMIDGPLTYTSPISIKTTSEHDFSDTTDVYTFDFTEGWDTYMPGADIASYFVPAETTKMIKLNEETGELYSEMKTERSISISFSAAGGSVTADKTTAFVGDTITLTATAEAGYTMKSLTVKDAEGNDVTTWTSMALDPVTSTVFFNMPDSDVTVAALFEPDYTVTASETKTADKRDTTDGTDVYAGDTVTVEVIVNGGAFTNADWSMVYDSDKFEFVSAAAGDGVPANATVTFDNTASNVLSGKVRGNAGITETGDELADGAVVAVYTFTAKPQVAEVTGTFAISSAHVNNYEMAGVQDNTPADTLGSCDVTIILNPISVAGTITAAEKEYNGQLQAGNPFELNDEYADKGIVITYSTEENGEYYTEPPMWKEVGEYTYWVKVEGAGLQPETYSTTLTITPKKMLPTITYKVDPDVTGVEITPVLEDLVDTEFTGTVTVTIGEGEDAQTLATLTAGDFVFDGSSSATAAPITITDVVSGDLTVTITYTEGDSDNYYAEPNPNEIVINVDAVTADDATIAALEDTIESIFEYDGEEHSAVIDADALAAINGWQLAGIVNAYDETNGKTSVTDVGDQELVKVTFTDTTGKYNEVVIYAVLKVTPRKVTITVNDYNKGVGEDDPLPFEYTITLDSDPTATNALIAATDLGTITTVREPGEAAGEYKITVSYKPNTNYEVTIDPGVLTIGAPVYNIEVVDLKLVKGGEYTPDYIENHRMILVYTDAANAYFTVDGENMFDVTAAGYKYVDNDYANNTFSELDKTWNHVYAMVVEADMEYAEPLQDVEDHYMDKVEFVGSDAAYKPEKIVYDEDINLTGELDVNDYSMTNGIYNVMYDRATFIKSILKADYNFSKNVDTDDAIGVKGVVDAD